MKHSSWSIGALNRWGKMVSLIIFLCAMIFTSCQNNSQPSNLGNFGKTNSDTDITGSGDVTNVKFRNIWLEHNATKDGIKGLNVHIDFNITDMEGKECKAIAYFDHPKGTGVEDKNGSYCTSDGHVCASQKFTPKYQSSDFSNLTIFIPLSELHLLSGKNTYYTRVFIQSSEDGFLGHSDFVSFDGTGNGDSEKAVNTNYSGKTWREDLGNGMFAIYQGNPKGPYQRTIYRACSTCRGSVVCPNCHGTTNCLICNGQGGIVTSGYGRYIPCAACNQSGKCGICHGSGKCVCANFEYPGYMPGSTIVVGPDGKVYYNSRDYDGGSSSSSSSSQSPSKSSSRGVCPKCGGRKYESTSYEYAAASAHGWAQPYHNDLGDKCPYCGYASDHYHYPCSECHGFGHN